MLMEWYIRLRGIDQWPEVDAKVQSAVQHIQRFSICKLAFTYLDSRGELHTVRCVVKNDSSLFNVRPGDTFPVRYNPAKPGQWFSDEYGLPTTAQLVVFVLCLFGFFAIMFGLNALLH